MRISSVGNRSRAGVTLVEMLLVVMILSLLVGLSFPVFSSGLESLRLISAADDCAALLNGSLNRAERRQHAVEVAIVPAERAMLAVSFDGTFRRRVDLPAGVVIVGNSEPRRFFLFPGGVPPGISMLLSNQRGNRRLVRLDPVSGVAIVEREAQP